MTEAQQAELRLALTRLRVDSGASYAFLFCAADQDGAPLLLVAPGRIDPRTLLALRRVARDGALTRGTVRYAPDGTLVFAPRGTPHPKMATHLALRLAAHFAPLRTAQIAQESSDGV